MKKITVKHIDVTILTINEDDYISLTDIARIQNPYEPKDVVKNWMRQKNTIEFLGLWEKLYNPDFKFTLSPSRWVDTTNAIGIISKSGRYGGTYAHKDIAFKFANWVSVEFELYLIKEIQRLKSNEKKEEAWTAKRELARINYHIHSVLIDDGVPQNERLDKLNQIAIQQMQLLEKTTTTLIE